MTSTELRELFLRRPVTQAVFHYAPDKGDAEAALATLRTLDRPPRLGDDRYVYDLLAHGFPRYNRQFTHDEIRGLLEAAAETSGDVAQAPKFDGVVLFHELLKLLRPESFRVYLNRQGVPIAVSSSSDGPLTAFVVQHNFRVEYYLLTAETLYAILEGTWRYGTTERRFVARDAICQHIADHIQILKDRALAEWDAAVAVQDDAMRVFKADAVVVYGEVANQLKATFHDAAAFAETKMIVPANKAIKEQPAKCTPETFWAKERLTTVLTGLLRRECTRSYFRFGDNAECKLVLFCERQVVGEVPAGGKTLL